MDYQYNARIPLERLHKIEASVVAARDALRKEADLSGGVVVEAGCRLCEAPAYGHVVTDQGEPESSGGPGVPAVLYVAGFVRSCNCDAPRSEIERDLIVAVATEDEK